MERIPLRFGPTPGYDKFLLEADIAAAIRYRFQVTGDVPGQWDIVVEKQKARMEESPSNTADVTIQCDTSTFVILMYKRSMLDSLIEDGEIGVQGHLNLVPAFDGWLKG